MRRIADILYAGATVMLGVAVTARRGDMWPPSPVAETGGGDGR